MTEWIAQTLELVSQENLHLKIDWEPVERALGTGLPADFKKFAESFGTGEFSDYLLIHTSEVVDPFSVPGALAGIHRALERLPSAISVYEPYPVFGPGGEGLIPWGRAVEEGVEFYWLAGGDDPDRWPVLARTSPGEEWYRFDMPASEFIFRMLSGDEKVSPFYIPEVMGPVRYEAY